MNNLLTDFLQNRSLKTKIKAKLRVSRWSTDLIFDTVWIAGNSLLYELEATLPVIWTFLRLLKRFRINGLVSCLHRTSIRVFSWNGLLERWVKFKCEWSAMLIAAQPGLFLNMFCVCVYVYSLITFFFRPSIQLQSTVNGTPDSISLYYIWSPSTPTFSV